MKSQRKSKSNQKGGECGNFTIIGEIAPGIPEYGLHQGANCNQNGGAKKKSIRSKNTSRKGKMSVKKRLSKVDEKKVDEIINVLCKSIKRKCTPKYRGLLKKIVIKNM
jgi:hypothetical protein